MNYLGLTGLLGLTGEPGGRPIQAAGQIADLGGGALMAAFGVMAALRERERSGEGQLVDVSMTDGALSWLAMVAARLFLRRAGAGAGRGPAQRRHRLLLPVRGGGRLGHLRGAGAEVLGSLLQRRRAPGPDREAVRASGLGRLARDRRGLPLADAGGVAGLQRRARRDDRAGSGPRRGARLRARSRARDGGRAGAAASWATVRLLGLPIKLSRTPGDAPVRRPPSASTPRRCWARRGSRRTRSRR